LDIHSRGMPLGSEIMKRPIVIVGILAALSTVMCCSGCIVFFREEPYAGKDPEADKFLKVKDVRGRNLILQNGREIRIAGLDITGLSEFQKQQFDRRLREYYKTGGGGLLADDGQDRQARVVASIPYVRYPLMFEWPAISLFPRRIEVPPRRVDVAAEMLSAGLARIKPDEIQDEKLRKVYIDAQTGARTVQKGLWAPPESQLVYASRRGAVAEVERLLAAGVDVNSTDLRLKKRPRQTALQVAVASGQKAVVEVLIRNGADVNAGIADGWSVLHQAVYVSSSSGQTGQDIVELLLAANADVVAADKARRLIDNLAVSCCPLRVIELLLKKGAKLDVKKNGLALPRRAVVEGKTELLRRLLDMGVDPDKSDAYGTLLICSVVWHKPEIAELLFARGADVNRKDEKGRTALDYAKELRYKKMEDLLLRHGAKN